MFNNDVVNVGVYIERDIFVFFCFVWCKYFEYCLVNICFFFIFLICNNNLFLLLLKLLW